MGHTVVENILYHHKGNLRGGKDEHSNATPYEAREAQGRLGCRESTQGVELI